MKQLQTLVDYLEDEGLLIGVEGDIHELAIEDIGYDSRQVADKSLFICKGSSFKEEYLASALAGGACAWLAEEKPNSIDAPGIVVSDIRSAMAIAADWFFESPWKKMTMIAVTGTKGKTTTVAYLKEILDIAYQAENRPAAGITSTQRIYDGSVDQKANLTTPETVDLYRHLDTAVKNGLETMIVEVSSQAVKYKRIGQIIFDHGVFLNISPDHISPIEHPDYEDYLHSKLRLFEVTKRAYISRESSEQEALTKAVQHCEKVNFFSIKNITDFYAANISWDHDGGHFEIFGKGQQFPVFLPMHGFFNVENALAAASVALSLGIDSAYVASGLARAELDGRMMYFHGVGKEPVTVLVDYAHNKISFENVFAAVHQEFPDANYVAVFGATGDKAVNRRYDLGLVASRYAHQIYLTADDPANETVDSINQDIAGAFERDVPWCSVPDRVVAIEDAILSAPEGSVVLVLGKGSERKQKMAKAAAPYIGDEYVAKAALEKRARTGRKASKFFKDND